MAAALECRARGLGHTGHMGHAHHSPSGHPAASIAREQHPEHAIPAALWCLVPHLGRSPPLEPFAFGAGLRLRSARRCSLQCFFVLAFKLGGGEGEMERKDAEHLEAQRRVRELMRRGEVA